MPGVLVLPGVVQKSNDAGISVQQNAAGETFLNKHVNVFDYLIEHL